MRKPIRHRGLLLAKQRDKFATPDLPPDVDPVCDPFEHGPLVAVTERVARVRFGDRVDLQVDQLVRPGGARGELWRGRENS